MAFEELFKLKTNPFRMTPALSSEELIWAGFPKLKERIINKIKRSIKIPNSSLVLNWGEYGSGKTHAARYFNKESVLTEIAKKESGRNPYSINIILPKGKNPVFDIHISIIDKISIKEMRDKFSDLALEFPEFIDSITDNLHIRSVLKAFFSSDVDEIIMKKYLYNQYNTADLKYLNDYGILRPLASDSDLTKFLAGLFSCFTYGKNKGEEIYSCIILWIDEFEDIGILSSVNVSKTNNFLREILDNTPNYFLVFLNLTQTALVNIEDLSEYLSEAVKSRIKEKINFELPSKENLLLYLEELLNNKNFRTEAIKDKLFPFDHKVVDELLQQLENLSLREVNDTFSLLLEIAEFEKVSPVTEEYFAKHKDEVIGWK